MGDTMRRARQNTSLAGTARALRWIRTAAIVGGTLAVASACQLVGTVTPERIPVAPGQSEATTTVQWRESFTGARIFIDLCRRPVEDPTFDLVADCDAASAVELPGSVHGRGQAEVALFVGPARDWANGGDSAWACSPEGWSLPEEVTRVDRCWVRIAYLDRANGHGSTSVGYEFVSDSAEIPEAPWVVMPLFVGVAGMVVVWVIRRRPVL
jgi:hypothetical protein